MRSAPFLILAACGSSGSPPAIDAAAEIDAAVDAPAIAGSVTVRISQEWLDPQPGTPVEGVTVVARDAAGTETMHVTDAQGIATFEIARGSTVFAARRLGTRGYVYVVMAVEPGATIGLGAWPRIPAGQSPTGNLVINFPPYPTTGPVRYTLDNVACGSLPNDPMGPSATIAISATGCDDTGRTLHVMARRESLELLGYLAIPNVKSRPGTMTATGTWTAPVTNQSTFTGMPAHVVRARTTAANVDVDWHRTAPITIDLVSGAGTASVPSTALAGPAQIITTLTGSDDEVLRVVEPGDPTSYVASGGALPPMFSHVRPDAGTRTVTWTETPAAIRPDAIRARIEYPGFSDPGTRYAWSVIAPGDVTSLALPKLPAAFPGFEMLPSAVTTGGISAVEVSGTGYRELLEDLDLFFDLAPITTYHADKRRTFAGG